MKNSPVKIDKETLYRYVRCRTTPEEELSVLEWLEQDAEHERLLSEIQHQHDLVAMAGPVIDELHARNRRRHFTLLRRWSAAAAVVVLLIAGGSLLRQNHRLSDRGRQLLTVEVPAGQHIKLTLQDGTDVWLNAGSRISYPALFADRERRVIVEGEARFEVTHDERHPFVVETRACDLEVLGTTFNVVAEADQEIFSAALFEGRVAITNRQHPDERIILRPNEVATLHGGHLQVGTVENVDDYRWTEGIINLTGRSFAELMERFEKAFGVTIRLEREPDIRIGQGKIRQSIGIDNALQVLQQFADFRYEKDEQTNTIIIR